MSVIKELASNVRDSRERLGLTQEQVADHLNIPRSAVSDIESGKRELSAAELVALARLFGEPIEELLGLKQPSPDDELVMLRAAEVTTSARRALNHWIHLCETYAQLEEWSAERLESKLRPMQRILSSYEDAQQLAEDERKRLGLGNTPAHELLRSLEERLGAKVLYLPLEDAISGASVTSKRFGPAILVNQAHPAGRRTFTLAHEFFHLLTEGRVARSGGAKPLHVCDGAAGAKKDRAEQLADRFAGELLLPSEHFRQRVAQLQRADGSIETLDLIGLAQYFGVSVRSVFVKFSDLKMLPWSTIDAAYNQLKEQARLSDGSKAQEPQRFQRLAIKAFLAQHISRSKLAEYLNVNVADVGDELKKWSAEDGGGGLKIPLPR